MKKIWYYFVIFFSLLACEEAIDLDLDTEPPRLVIDAALLRTRNENTATGFENSAQVNLSFTRSFFSETPLPVTNAQVTITAINANIILNFIHVDGGSYALDSESTTKINGIDPTESFKLSVIHNGETYESTEKLQLATPIIEAKQIKNPGGFDEEDFVIEVTFQDKPGSINYFVFDFGGGDIFSIDDEFIEEGSAFTFINNFDKQVDRDLKIKLIGADQRFAIYIDDLATITTDSGGPFGVVPFKVRGNIVNITNPDNFPFGYFRVNEVYESTILLEDTPKFFDE